MSNLILNSTPAERMWGRVFSENFESNGLVIKNGGTVLGTPNINFGADLNGSTDYVTYSLTNSELVNDELTFEIEFYPNFDPNDGSGYYFIDSTDSDYYIYKNTTPNQLRFFANATLVGEVDLVNYQSYWITGGRNVLTCAFKSGDTNAWLNGNQIVTNSSTAYTASSYSEDIFWVGRYSSSSLYYFDGIISKVHIDKALIENQEAVDFYNNNVYNYRERAVIDLPLISDTYDPTNTRFLDISRNANHAGYTIGVSEPTKLQKRGVSTDGNDILQTNSSLFIDTGYLTMAVLCRVMLGTDQIIASIDENGSDLGGILQYYGSSDEWRFYSGGGAEANSASYNWNSTPHNSLVTLVGVYDGTDTRLYVNGLLGTNAATPLAPGITSSMKLTLLTFGSFAQYLSVGSEVLQYITFDFALTPLQVADLHIRMLQRVNAV